MRISHCSGSSRRLTRIAMVLVLAMGVLAQGAAHVRAQAPARASDDAVLSALRRSNPALRRQLVWRRQPVSADTDIVLALAWPETWGCDRACESAPVGPGMVLGLFAQDRRVPDRVNTLTLESDLLECFVRMLRVSSADLTLSCTGEKSETLPNLKFVYDISRKALVGRYSYSPYSFADARLDSSSAPPRVRVLARGAHETSFDMVAGAPVAFSRASDVSPAGPRVFASDAEDLNLDGTPFGPSGAFRTVQDPNEPDAFDRRLAVESTVGRRTRYYRLPQTPYRAFTIARPDEVTLNPGTRYNIDERIGPTKIVDGKLWFGKAFYNGEGFSGVGGLGYFDPADRRFHIFTGPAIADWSVSSLLVERDVVWATLGYQGEWGGEGGGVVRFHRQTGTFRKMSAEANGSFLRVSADMMLVVGSRLTVIRSDRSESYFVDEMPEGQPRVVPLQ